MLRFIAYDIYIAMNPVYINMACAFDISDNEGLEGNGKLNIALRILAKLNPLVDCFLQYSALQLHDALCSLDQYVE